LAYHALTSHFASFFGRLNPGTSFESTASSQYNTIKGLIEDRSGLAASLSPICFLQGSYKQQTAIYSINDVDIVVLCRLWSPGSGVGRSYSRDEIFETIASPLKQDGRYKSKLRYGPTSMCIKADLGIKVEILPVVFKVGNEDYSQEPFHLYRPTLQRWEDGFARYHQYYLSAKNKGERTGGNFIPAIKIVKHLRSLFNLNAVSFHIECLLYSLPDHLFVGAPSDYVAAILSHLASVPANSWYGTAVRTPCGDRDVFTGNEWSLQSWSVFHAWIQKWSNLAIQAHDAQYKETAIRYWRLLFGQDYFPESAV
jgi:hypothetical protein